MSSISIAGDTSGAVTLAAPAIAGTNTMTLLAATGNLGPKVLSTAVTSTSGTSIDFTSIPSWITRITVMLNGVSLSGTTEFLIQFGSGSITTSGYVAYSQRTASNGTAYGAITSTSGMVVRTGGASTSASIITLELVLLNGNNWISKHVGSWGTTWGMFGAGSIGLSGALDRVRITTVNGTDTFTAGTINIMYE